MRLFHRCNACFFYLCVVFLVYSSVCLGVNWSGATDNPIANTEKSQNKNTSDSYTIFDIIIPSFSKFSEKNACNIERLLPFFSELGYTNKETKLLLFHASSIFNTQNSTERKTVIKEPKKFLGVDSTSILQFMNTKPIISFLNKLFYKSQGYFSSTNENIVTAACQSLELNRHQTNTMTSLGYCILIEFLEMMSDCFFSYPHETLNCDQHAIRYKNKTYLPDEVLVSPLIGYDFSSIPFSGFIPLNRKNLNVNVRNPLPNQFDYDSIALDEGLTYFLLFRASYNVQYAVNLIPNCHKPNQNPVPDLIPGWETDIILSMRNQRIRKVNYLQYASSTPLVVLSKPRLSYKSNNSCEILIIFNSQLPGTGPINMFTSSLRAFIPGNPHIKAHEFFTKIALLLFSPIELYIQDTLNEKCNSTLDVTLTGHSLGGAIGQIVALYLATALSHFPISFFTVFSGAPSVFNRAGALLYSQTINGRILHMNGDPFTNAPCSQLSLSNEMSHCSNYTTLKSSSSSSSLDDMYVPSPGLITLPMPSRLSLPDTWYAVDLDYYGDFTGYRIMLASPLMLFPLHICSYACLLSIGKLDFESGWMCNEDTCPIPKWSREFELQTTQQYISNSDDDDDGTYTTTQDNFFNSG